jgi:hypothetical protein
MSYHPQNIDITTHIIAKNSPHLYHPHCCCWHPSRRRWSLAERVEWKFLFFFIVFPRVPPRPRHYLSQSLSPLVFSSSSLSSYAPPRLCREKARSPGVDDDVDDDDDDDDDDDEDDAADGAAVFRALL